MNCINQTNKNKMKNKESEYVREYKKQGLVPILDWKMMPMKRKQAKINRNCQCPCGSGKKYKQCCLNNYLQ